MIYQRLSESIITKIDLRNLSFDSIAINNSLILLCDIGMIQFDNVKNVFLKTLVEELELDEFSEMLYTGLKSSYPNAFSFFDESVLRYDETEAKLYIKRNCVSLDLSGLLMILDGIKKIRIQRNDIFILDKGLLNCRKDRRKDLHRHKTLIELKEQLEINEGHGVDAELAAVEYEAEMLKAAGISKSPERLSEYYVNAGYDIMSFSCAESLVPDKFIEVKSCSDSRWIFYFSKNEMEVAKSKQDSYYLYLYNRTDRRFRIIQNPYEFFWEGDEKNQWAIESQVYQIRSLE
jgi:hypothetical protein